MSVYVNDVFVKKLSLPPTATWKDWGIVTDQLELQAGPNVVKIQRDAGDNGNVNIDYLDLGARSACAPGETPGADDEFDGTTLDTCRWSTILNKTPTGVAVADGQLRINAQSGDLSGGAVDAKNMVLQDAPADGTWAATTQLTMTGADDYLQGGLVAWTNATNYAKFVAMEKPDGDWVLELGRRINGDMVYTNADLPEGAAPDDLQLQLVSTGTAVQGLWSVDQGATWTSMGAGYPSTGLVAPKIGVAAYNGTGSQVGAFDWFKVSGDPVIEPDTCEATEADPGYRTLFDGTAESLEDWNMAGPGLFTREADCTLKGNGGLGLLWHSEPLEGDYSLQLDWKLTKDDNGGVFVGFPDPGTTRRSPSTTATRSRSTPRTPPTARPVRSTRSRAPTSRPRRRAQPGQPVEPLRDPRGRQADPDLPQRRAGQRLHQPRNQPNRLTWPSLLRAAEPRRRRERLLPRRAGHGPRRPGERRVRRDGHRAGGARDGRQGRRRRRGRLGRRGGTDR